MKKNTKKISVKMNKLVSHRPTTKICLMFIDLDLDLDVKLQSPFGCQRNWFPFPLFLSNQETKSIPVKLEEILKSYDATIPTITLG